MRKELYDGDLYLNDRGELVEICADDWCESPREWDNLGTFYTWMRSYTTPDGDRPSSIGKLAWRFGFNATTLKAFIRKFNHECGVAMPVWFIEHSGMTYKAATNNPFCDPWDSGLAGVIFATNERIRELRGVDDVTRKVRADVREELVSEVGTYDDWANGRIHGFRAYDKAGNVIDDCWGFVGNDFDGVAAQCGGLNECGFSSVEEYVEAHENDPDVVVGRYNAMMEHARVMAGRMADLLRDFDESGIEYEFDEDGKLELVA